jgi:hypothetical protein
MPPRQRNPHVTDALVGILLVAVVGVVMWWLVGTRTDGNLGSSTAAQTALVPTIAQLSAPPATAILAPTLDLPATTTQNAIATISAAKQQGAATFVVKMTTSPIATGIPGPTGISEVNEPTRLLLAREGLTVQNGWGGYINGHAVSVWAGTTTTNPDEGVIEVMWVGPQQTLRQRFTISGQHGWLKISAEQNNRLTLASADKATYYFDVPGLRVASSLAEIVPTVDFSLMATAPATPLLPMSTPMAPTAYP